MKLKVSFRAYDKPYVDPDTGEEERGEYLWSFTKDIEGDNPLDILNNAERVAEERSRKDNMDVRVWETIVVATPRGIQQ